MKKNNQHIEFVLKEIRILKEDHSTLIKMEELKEQVRLIAYNNTHAQNRTFIFFTLILYVLIVIHSLILFLFKKKVLILLLICHTFVDLKTIYDLIWYKIEEFFSSENINMLLKYFNKNLLPI